jgi:hypothetical protein
MKIIGLICFNLQRELINNCGYQHIYEMAGLVQKTNFVHQRKLSAKKKHRFSKTATS